MNPDDKIAKLENEANHYCTEWRLAKVHAAEWHGVVETICTIVGLSPALGAQEAAGEVRNAFYRLQRERDGFKEDARQRMAIAVEQKRRADKLEEVLHNLTAIFGSRPDIYALTGFAERPVIERARGICNGVERARGAGKRAVQALAGLSFGTNPDRLELEDHPTGDPLCARCADQEAGSPPLPPECTCQ